MLVVFHIFIRKGKSDIRTYRTVCDQSRAVKAIRTHGTWAVRAATSESTPGLSEVCSSPVFKPGHSSGRQAPDGPTGCSLRARTAGRDCFPRGGQRPKFSLTRPPSTAREHKRYSKALFNYTLTPTYKDHYTGPDCLLSASWRILTVFHKCLLPFVTRDEQTR